MRYVLKENISGKELSSFMTILNVVKEDNKLFFEFDCKNSQFFSYSDKYNDPIWNGDVCEAFISVDGSKTDYYEIEVAPNNTVFCMLIHNDNGNLAQTEISENDCFVRSEVYKNGNNYKVKFSVDLTKMGYKDGKILFNAFRIETEGGIPECHLLALNPTLCDIFHKPEFFIEL